MQWFVGTMCGVCLLAYAPTAGAGPFGYLYPPAYSIEPREGLPVESYGPRPGDLILASNTNLFWATVYHFAGTGKPSHAGIVLALPDGRPAVLEAWSDRKPIIAVVPLEEWMGFYKGSVWVRQRKTPLTAEQSCLLTRFAQLNDKKPYAILRLMSQLTPFRARGILRTHFFGKPRGIRDRYYCSELVLEAMVYAGLLDPQTARPGATYPRDMFYDCSLIPYLNRHLHLECNWEVPARWTRCP